MPADGRELLKKQKGLSAIPDIKKGICQLFNRNTDAIVCCPEKQYYKKQQAAFLMGKPLCIAVNKLTS